ncbi:hypothetical protein CVT24_002387, partial [Panaeolus cyanescens]
VSAWFKSGTSLFLVEISRYLDQSAKLAEIYNDIVANNETAVGGTESNPIVIEGVTRAHVDLFFEFIAVNRNWGGTTTRQTYLKDEIIGCIKMAQMLQIASAEQELLRQLDINSQSPAFRLYVAFVFHDATRIHNCLELLISKPLNESDDMRRLSYDVYEQVVLARDAIQRQRALIAATFPAIARMTSSGRPCKDHLDCKVTCDQLWQIHIATPLLKTTEPEISVRDKFIKALMDINSGINHACAAHMRDDLMNYPAWQTAWGQEREIFSRAKARIICLLEEF